MSLWESVRRAGYKSLAVCGMAKNTGKTVTLNHLIQGANRQGASLGLTSIGRDGEAYDVLTFRRKPAVRVEAGCLAATAEMCLGTGTAVLEPLERTRLRTPLGHVVAVRAESGGTIELAGPSRLQGLREVVERLHRLGAELVLVDGAADRRGPASPRVTQGLVLATGAVLAPAMDEVVRITRLRVAQLQLPAAPGHLECMLSPGFVTLVSGRDIQRIPVAAAMRGALAGRVGRKPGTKVIVGGALTEGLMRELGAGGPGQAGISVVVRDATCVFMEDDLFSRFLKAGGRLEVLEPMQLAGVTVNPTSPEGPGFDAFCFHRAVREALAGVEVYDVVQGYGPSDS
jgi:hypothetical protein